MAAVHGHQQAVADEHRDLLRLEFQRVIELRNATDQQESTVAEILDLGRMTLTPRCPQCQLVAAKILQQGRHFLSQSLLDIQPYCRRRVRLPGGEQRFITRLDAIFR